MVVYENELNIKIHYLNEILMEFIIYVGFMRMNYDKTMKTFMNIYTLNYINF